MNGDGQEKRMSNEELVDELIAEADGDTRRIGTDPPSLTWELRAEVLSRLNNAAIGSEAAGVQ